MLFDRAQQQLRLPSISELVLPNPMEICGTEPVRVKHDDEDCARILAGLHGPAAMNKSEQRDWAAPRAASAARLPSISLLLNQVECPDPSGSLLRRASCESLGSVTPSLSSNTTSAASSPATSPKTPTIRLPVKFAEMRALEPGFGGKLRYDYRQGFKDANRGGLSHIHGGRILKPSSPPAHAHRIELYCNGDLANQDKPRRAPPRSRGKPHNNIPYTEEQNHWVIYHKVDLGLSWREVEDRFNVLFPLPPPYDRTDGGLQSTFYRWNDRMPLLTDDWLLVLDDHSRETYGGVGFRTHKVKVRASGKSGEACGNVTLIARYAEQIVDKGYSWVSPADMAHARDIAARRRRQRQEYLDRKATLRSVY